MGASKQVEIVTETETETEGGAGAAGCRIGVLGCGGRMGRMLLAETLATPGARLVGGADPGPGIAGSDLGAMAGGQALGIAALAAAPPLFEIADVLIDFSRPDAAQRHAELAAEAGKGLVLGTTGLGAAERRAIMAAGARAALVVAANMSLGVNLLLGLVEAAARQLGPDWDIEILEMHHRYKLDAPSGTALALGHAAAAGRGVTLAETMAKSMTLPDGAETAARRPGQIGFASLRGGDVIGDHTVVFAGDAERIELTHKATDRRLFARGALKAALWLRTRPPGVYGMRDVLGM